MVEHLPYHPKVKGLSTAIGAGTGREKMVKRITFNTASDGSIVVRKIAYYHKDKGLSPVDAVVPWGGGGEENGEEIKLLLTRPLVVAHW